MDNEDRKNLLIILAMPTIIIGIWLISFPIGLFDAWIIQKLYGWFALPLGAPALNLLHIYGFMLIINILRFKNDPNAKKDKNTATTIIAAILSTVIVGLLALLVGWIIKNYI